MHLADGLLGPATYATAWAVAVPLWAWAVRRSARQLNEATVPHLGVLTGLAFALSAVAIPLPGGTSGHLLGVALLALTFGIAPAFVAISLVLALQALLFGAGGLLALPVGALATGGVGAVVAVTVHRALRAWHEDAAVAVASWASVVLAATVIALVLGAQPHLATTAAGDPLFFPFGPEITLPAIVGPHLLVGVGEALLTAGVLRLLQRRRRLGAVP